MDRSLTSLSPLLFVNLLCVCVRVSCCLSLPPCVCVVSMVQITLNSHVRNLIEVIRFTLCSVCRLPSPSGSRPRPDESNVLVTNTNLI